MIGKRKGRKLLLGLLLIMILAAIAYAAKSLWDAHNRSGTMAMDNRKNNISTLDVLITKTEPKQQPSLVLEQKFDNLKREFDKANEERKKDKKVSEQTREKAISIAKEINAICADMAKKAREAGLDDAAKFFENAGENVLSETKVHMKDEVSSEDNKTIRKQRKEEQTSIDSAYEGFDGSSLTPEKKSYLEKTSLVNLASNLVEVTALITSLKLIMDDLEKSPSNKGGFACMRQLVSGGTQLQLAKSLMDLCQDLKAGMESSTKNLKRLVKG